MRKGRQKRVLD